MPKNNLEEGWTLFSEEKYARKAASKALDLIAEIGNEKDKKLVAALKKKKPPVIVLETSNPDRDTKTWIFFGFPPETSVTSSQTPKGNIMLILVAREGIYEEEYKVWTSGKILISDDRNVARMNTFAQRHDCSSGDKRREAGSIYNPRVILTPDAQGKLSDRELIHPPATVQNAVFVGFYEPLARELEKKLEFSPEPRLLVTDIK